MIHLLTDKHLNNVTSINLLQRNEGYFFFKRISKVFFVIFSIIKHPLFRLFLSIYSFIIYLSIYRLFYFSSTSGNLISLSFFLSFYLFMDYYFSFYLSIYLSIYVCIYNFFFSFVQIYRFFFFFPLLPEIIFPFLSFFLSFFISFNSLFLGINGLGSMMLKHARKWQFGPPKTPLQHI